MSLTGQLASKSIDDYEREAKDNLEGYAPEFREQAAAVKIACLQQEVDRLQRRAMRPMIDESEARMARREFSKVGETIHVE